MTTRGSETAVDPVRLNVLHASFRLADEEFSRRRANGTSARNGRSRKRKPKDVAKRKPRGANSANAKSGEEEAAQLAGMLRGHIQALDDAGLRALRMELAQSLLMELDHRIAGGGELPGKHVNASEVADRAARLAVPPTPRVALVSMPWMSPAMPSIQLATLAAALKAEQIAADVHELYVDFAARIGLNLYNQIGNLLGYIPEWIFSRHYYGPEHGDDLSALLDEHPLADSLPWPEMGNVLLSALEPVTDAYLDDMLESVDWSQYDIVGFSLTISQLGASMAMARPLKLRHPEIKVVFGGSQCAGVMGNAFLRVCPYVDVIVHVEGEPVLGKLVRRLRGGQSLQGLAGISYRDSQGEIVTAPPGELHRSPQERLPLDYDSYFRRVMRLGLLGKVNPWLPFEGSRGCWYGQKTQCTFCGLHEIMEFRAWEGDAVLRELERLNTRYGINRFYSMDLILPRKFLETLLPEIVRRGHDWMIFYEVKTNMRHDEMALLAAAGIRWVQPGIESLDADLLGLMKKGVSPLQNILFLKWSCELGIFCGWNLISGLPGETSDSYERMVELIPKLFHLTPPSGGGSFQLHRFSPYFDDPDQFGIRWLGAHHMYRYAFPISGRDLNDLVYLHDFELTNGEPRVDLTAVTQAVQDWRAAHAQGASLQLTVSENGTSRIEDGRQIGSPARVHDLNEEETTLYLFLDAGVAQHSMQRKFASAHPGAASKLGSRIDDILESWRKEDFVLFLDGRVASLAVQPQRSAAVVGAPYMEGVDKSHTDHKLLNVLSDSAVV